MRHMHQFASLLGQIEKGKVFIADIRLNWKILE